MVLRSKFPILKSYFEPRLLSIRELLGKKFSTDTKVHDQSENMHQTHFGYETVDEHAKSGKGIDAISGLRYVPLPMNKMKMTIFALPVYEVFEKVASSYDQMNDAMSFGIHRVWKHVFIQRLNPPHGTNLLDVAGGSGKLLFQL